MRSLRVYISVGIAALGFTAYRIIQRYSTYQPISTPAMASLMIPLNDGTSIPWFGFGTGSALYQKDAKEEVLMAIETGVIHIDGAQMYGNEQSLGNAITASGKPRNELYVTTKLNKVPPGLTVRDTLVESLKKLQIDHVDLFLIHMPLDHELKSTWKQMEEVQKEGLTTSIGVSNFRVQDFEKFMNIATVKPAINQVIP